MRMNLFSRCLVTLGSCAVASLATALGQESVPPTGATETTESEAASEGVSPVRAPQALEDLSANLDRPAPFLLATDIDGRSFNLRQYAAGQPVVVALTSTTCPLCRKFGPTLAELEQQFQKRGIKFVYVVSIATDPLDDVRRMRDELGWSGPVLLDRNQELVQALAADTTTEAFLYDANLTLRYRGAVDDQYGLGYTKPAPTQRYLAAALESLLQQEVPAVRQTSAPGCRIQFPTTSAERPLEYHRDIARIIQNHCLDCHRTDGIGPFPLESPEQVIAHAGMISEVVNNGSMPPWFAAADPSRPHRWINDTTLTDEQRERLQRWLAGEQALGSAELGPIERRYDNRWSIGTPDLVASLPQRNRIRSTGFMDYLHQKIELTHTEDRWIQAVEIRPTAPEVVHHVLVYALPRDSRQLDIDERSHFLAAYVPGNSNQMFPPGMAKKLPANHDLVLQMHYTPNGRATFDQTEIAFRFADGPPDHEILVTGIANTGIRIQPGAAHHPENAELTVPQSAVVTAFFPHMHLRGKAFRMELETAEGRQTLLEVPRYDFNWQLEYRLLNPLTLAAGNRILVTGWFDNSADNPYNPDPTRLVGWGKQTTDEMLIGYVEYYYTEKSNNPLQQPRQRATAEQMFQRMDRNGDGLIQRDELRRAALFDAIDADKDGRLTLEEVKQAWPQLERRR